VQEQIGGIVRSVYTERMVAGLEQKGNCEEGQEHTGNGGSVRSRLGTVGVSKADWERWDCQEHKGNSGSIRSIQRMIGVQEQIGGIVRSVHREDGGRAGAKREL